MSSDRTLTSRISRVQTFALTALALVAFASNSLLCRLALKTTSIDPVTFTSIRLVAGAVMLWLVARLRTAASSGPGNWMSAGALLAYAVAFSLAYVRLPAAVGALLLFGAVQATMIGHGLWQGERLSRAQTFGLTLAAGGLTNLLLPGLSAPPLFQATLMLAAGVAWGVYSLRGRAAGDPIRVTAGNFLRAAPLTVGISVVAFRGASFDSAGCGYAVASGALASGLGYAVWYTALPHLKATQAATVQLSVPVLTTVGGVVFLGEPLTLRAVVSSTAILGGIALVIREKQRELARRLPPPEPARRAN